MSNTTTKNDWIAIRLLNDNATPDQMIVSGITPENSIIQSPEFYKNKAKVQEKFTKEDGSFDEKAFNDFYTESLLYYQYLNGVNTEDYILNTYEKSASNFTTDFGVYGEKKMMAQFDPNSYRQSLGVVGVNELSEIELSQRELAQDNYYKDINGNWSDQTVNEIGPLGLLNNNLAYATWDEDGYHTNPITGEQTYHEAGEWKTDPWGDFYIESAGNGENLNKQFVKLTEVLTDDSGAWNIIDIFDSDNLNQNIPKTIFKSAAIVAAFLIPPIAPYVIYSTSAIALARTLPQITKTFYSLFNENAEFDKLNQWDNYMQKFKPSKSDYAQQHFMAFENIMDMAVSSFTQLAQQRAIGEIPSKLKGFKNAKKAIQDHVNKVKINQILSKGDEAMSLTDEMVENLVKASSEYKKLKGNLDQYEKLSKIISRGYLIATSTEDTYNIARQYGFDTQTSSIISLATMAAVGTLFSTDYFRGMLYNTSDYEIERDIKILIKNYLQNNKSKITKEAAETTSDVGTQNFFKKHGKSITDFFKTHIADVNSGRFGIGAGMLNEALEETSEELAADAAIQIGKGWNKIKSAFTGKEYNDTYSYEESDPLKRYATAFVGGAFGGMIFKMADRIHFDKEAFHNWHKMLGDNSQIMNELVTYVSQGKKDFIINEIKKLEKSPMISGNLSAFDGKPTNIEAETQNNVLFSTFKKAISDLDTFFTNHNLKIDRERFEDIELLKGLRVAWVKSKGLSDSLFADYQGQLNKMTSLFSELQHNETQLSAAQTEEEKIPLKTKIKELNEEIENRKDLLRKLVNGEDDSYIGRLMMETNPHIASSIMPTTKDELSLRDYGSSYEKLEAAFKAEIDKKYKKLVDSGELEIKYYKAWELYKSISNTDNFEELVNIKMPKDLGLLSFMTLGQNGLLNLSRSSLNEAIDYKNPNFLFPLVREILKPLTDLDTSKLNVLSSRAIGLNTIPDYIEINLNDAIVYDEDSPLADEMITLSLLGINENKIKELITTLKNEYISLAENYIEQFNQIETQEELEKINNRLNGESIFFKYVWQNVDKANLDDFFQTIENTLLSNLNTVNEIEVINLDHIYNLMDSIAQKLGYSSLNIKEFIVSLQKNMQVLGKDFRIDESTLNKLNNIRDVIGVAKSVLTGAYDQYSTLLHGTIPFGANNFINDASNEKKFGYQLLQLDKNQVEVSLIKLDSIFEDIRSILMKGAENERQVVVEQQKGALQYDRQRISQLIDFANSATNIGIIDANVFVDLTADLPTVFQNMTEKEMLDVGKKMRQVLINFEEKFYNFINKSENKTAIIEHIANYCGKNDLYKDVTPLRVIDENAPDSQNKVIFKKIDLWHYLQATSFDHLSEIMTNYETYVDELNKRSEGTCPFDSQEQVITQVLKFLYRDRDLSMRWNEQVSEVGNLKKLNHAVKLMAAGGTGKSSTMIAGTYHIILHSGINRKCVFTANTQDQIDSIRIDIDKMHIQGYQNPEYMLHSELIKKLLSEDENNLNEYKNSIIFMDECTYISQNDLVELDKVCDKYGIDIIYSGDVDQGGIHDLNIDNIYAYSTPILIDSFRAYSDILRYNLHPWRDVISDSNGAITVNFPNTFEQLYYKQVGQTFAGLFIETSTDKDGNPLTMNVEYIDSFLQNHPLPENSKVLIFTDQFDANFKELITKYPKINFQVKKEFEQIQGAQWDYVFSDKDLVANVNNKNIMDGVYAYRDVYTAVSRPKHGMVTFKTPKFNKNGINVKFINKPSQTPPVSTGMTPETVKHFIDFKKSILKEMTYSKKTTSPQKGQLGPAKEVLEYDVINNSSVAQCSPGFSYDPDYTKWVDILQNLNISANLDQIKMTILNGITTNLSNWKESLPEELRNGEVLLTFMNTSVSELRNFGNLNRDYKFVDGVHPWLVYSVIIDGKRVDIHLGMFHNEMGTIVQNLSLTPATALVNIGMNESSMKDKYYRLKEGTFTITRNGNPIAIQENVTNSNVSISYENGRMTTIANVAGNPYGYISTSQAFYNDLNAANTLPMIDIHNLLKTQRILYKSLFEDLKKLYNLPDKEISQETLGQEINELLELELIGFTRPKYDDQGHILSSGYFRAKSVPNIAHRFVSFVRLNTTANQDNRLEYMATEYKLFLEAQNKRLEKVIEILKNSNEKSFDEIHESLKDVMRKKLNSNVTILAYDPDYIEDGDFDITLSKIMRKQTNTGRYVDCYNNAILNQLGLVLQRIAHLYTSSNVSRDFGITENAKTEYVSVSDVEAMKIAFDKHKEALIQEFKSWGFSENEGEKLEEDFFNFLKTTVTTVLGDKSQELEFASLMANENKSAAFRNFFKDVFVNQDTHNFWSTFLSKTNLLQYLSKAGRKKLNNDIYFIGHIYSKLIKDNGFNLKEYGAGKMYIVENGASLGLQSKVVQPPQIHVHIVKSVNGNTVKFTDIFEEYIEKPVVGQAEDESNLEPSEEDYNKLSQVLTRILGTDELLSEIKAAGFIKAQINTLILYVENSNDPTATLVQDFAINHIKSLAESDEKFAKMLEIMNKIKNELNTDDKGIVVETYWQASCQNMLDRLDVEIDSVSWQDVVDHAKESDWKKINEYLSALLESNSRETTWTDINDRINDELSEKVSGVFEDIWISLNSICK